jgi:two-component system phosphate regulon sensor histidine kinase PhoR
VGHRPGRQPPRTGDQPFGPSALRLAGRSIAEVQGANLLEAFRNTRLQALETVRRDFVANVSHVLKTPITAVKGSLETLLPQ